MSNLVSIDQQRPLSYISWLQLYNKTAVTDQVSITEYNQYIHDWHITNNVSFDSDTQSIINLYQNLLSEISLNYTTAEEKRFLSNIDFTDQQDLDIIIPFFAKKIKEISQYLVAKREEAKQAKIKYNFYGSNLGLEKNINNLIYGLISNNDFKNQFDIGTFFPTLSDVINSMVVDVSELYDITTYFDQPSANNVIEPVNIINLQQAIINLLYTYPLSLGIETTGLSAISATSTPQGLSLLTANNKILLINVQRSSILDLPVSEFVNANQNINNLDLSIQPELVKKYMGTTFYYLSTGSTVANSISGILFTPNNYYANFLNRYFPTQVMIPNDTNFYTIQQIGSFFTPDKIGLLSFISFYKNFQIDTVSLSSNTIYVFPDPNVYEPGRGNSQQDQFAFIIQTEDISETKADNSNGLLAGDIFDINLHQKFFPYQSREESLKYQPSGLSRSYDSVDFFTGTTDSIWNNFDLYPVVPLQTPPFQTRINDLVVSDDILVEWKTDIFGNDFGLYKKIVPKRSYLPIAPTNLYSTIYEDPSICRTFSSDNSSLSSDSLSLSDRFNTNGTLLVRSNQQPYINIIPNAFNFVFAKYQDETELMTQLVSAVKDFDIIDDIIMIQTSSYIVIEKYSYDFKTNIYESIVGKKTFLKLIP